MVLWGRRVDVDFGWRRLVLDGAGLLLDGACLILTGTDLTQNWP
jgi:hypothetical protein